MLCQGGHRIPSDDRLKRSSIDTPSCNLVQGTSMLSWSAGFFLIAIIAAVFGFGGIAEGAASIAKILFFLFMVLFVVSLFMGSPRKRGP